MIVLVYGSGCFYDVFILFVKENEVTKYDFRSSMYCNAQKCKIDNSFM